LLITMNLNQYSTSAAQPGISAEVIGRLRVPFPNFKEQTAITHYLDTKLGEINALIDKQQTLLEKLAEQRTAVITQAVTKGLNPAAPMKNSGVEWLGDVPAHWQLINLKFLCRVKGGYAFSSDNFSDDGIPVIRISDILFDGTVDNINCKRIPLELTPNQKDFELRNGQLVMAMTGATIGKISKYSSEDYAYINQRVGKFEAFNSKLNYAFLYHLLNTSGYQEHIKLTAFGGAQPNISDSEMVNYQMALPTMEEQANIADYLDQEAAKIDRLCDTVNQTIGRLKEYRTALITQAVTGKIKVTDE
ncbi:MAG: restriction endonuclease subunit S, partial [Aggregatibacter sp.]|uniref:restriction endonuclease subunit S n=1 Tax=Aggregatibacter sp. TaxID=1872413 RepID=UPI003622C9FE